MGKNLDRLKQAYALGTVNMANGGTPPNSMSNVNDAITSYYQNILGRAPEAGALDYWGGKASAGLPLDDIRAAIYNSPEKATREQIKRVYEGEFGRAAEPAAIPYWMEKAKGLNEDQLSSAILRGAAENDRVAAINRAYNIAFGRDAEAAGLDWWLRDWNKVIDDGSIMDDILRGAQNQDRTSAVNRLGYQELLGREGEQAGLEGWTNPETYKEITAGGLSDLRSSILTAAQNQDRENAIKRSYEIMFNRDIAPVELQGWLDKYQEAAEQGLRNPIAQAAMGDDRQRLVYNADTGMFNPLFTLDKTAGETFRDYVLNQPQNALGTSTYLKSDKVWDQTPAATWKNPNVVPDDYFPDPFKSSTTGVGDLTWGFQGTGGFTPEQFQKFEQDARVGTKTTQDLLNERFGVDGKPGKLTFANVSVPPTVGSLGPGTTTGTGSNRVATGTGQSVNYIPAEFRDDKGNYKPPVGGWPHQNTTTPTPAPIPSYGFELNNLMRQYGVTSPTAAIGQPVNMYNRAQFNPAPNNVAPPVTPPATTLPAINLDEFRRGAQPLGFARGGYAEGGEAEGEREERSSAGAMTPDQARRYRELMTRYLPSTNYGPQLATAQQAARSEAEAFSNMIRQMSERTESPTSRAEMYFRLASAFGAPTRTGQFTENLALAGREMGEVARGRRAEEAERRALGLRAQELRMAGARQDLASLQALAGQESAERRAILPRIIEAEVRANTPNARENRINDVMQTLGIGRPLAVGIVDNIITVVPGGPGEPPVLINRATGEIIPTRMGAAPVVGTQPAGQPAGQPAEQPAATPSAPAAGEIPAVNLRRPQVAASTAPATPSGATTSAAPTSVEDFYAGRRQRQVEQAGQTAEAEARGRVTAPPAPRQDFRYTQDFQAVEPIPGSVAAQEQEQRDRAERVRREATERAGGTVIRAINDIEQTMRIAALPTTGFFGERLSNVGGTAANDIRASLDTVRANIGFDQLNQMRQASPTGGALGNVTERELNFLQAVLGSVDQSQTEAQFRQNLRRLRDVYYEIINYGLGNRPPVQIPGPGGRGTAEPPRAGASGEIRSPSGLIIRPIQ